MVIIHRSTASVLLGLTRSRAPAWTHSTLQMSGCDPEASGRKVFCFAASTPSVRLGGHVTASFFLRSRCRIINPGLSQQLGLL